jgi:sec-independent protein translocase protein TatA
MKAMMVALWRPLGVWVRIIAAQEYGRETMPQWFGGWELIIVLVIVLLIFGVGRISKLGEELGKGIRAFREGVKEGQEDDKDDTSDGSDKTE